MTTTASAPPPRRRLRALLPLAPLLLALAYAGGHALLRRRPSLDAMVPDDAIVTWRYRDLAAFDAAHASSSAGDRVRPSEELGAQLNLPGLPGVARDRPLLEISLDPATRPDPRYFVLPVDDAAAVERTFRDPDRPERHARHVVVHGPWAAATWDHRLALDAGAGGGVLPPLPPGALWSATADWPRFVDAALLPWVASSAPYAGALEALGFHPKSARPTTDDDAAGGGGEPSIAVDAGRVPFVRAAWQRITVTAAPDRVRAELVPAPTSELVPLLAAAIPAPGAAPPARTALAPPVDADAWLRVADARGRRAVVLALWYAGVAWPAAASANGFAALHIDGDGDDPAGALTVAAVPSPGLLPAWTLGVASPVATLPDLAAFDVPAPATGRDAPLAQGVGRLRAPFGGPPAAGEVSRAPAPDAGTERVAFVAVGVGAAAIGRAWSASATPAPFVPTPDAAGLTLLAQGFLRQLPAQRLLGRALEPGGLFAALAEADLDVALLTDGTRLVLDLHRAARAGH